MIERYNANENGMMYNGGINIHIDKYLIMQEIYGYGLRKCFKSLLISS